MQDLSLVEALQRILGMALEEIRSAGITAENTLTALVDSIMNIAVDMLKTGQRLFINNNVISANWAKLETLVIIIII